MRGWEWHLIRRTAPAKGFCQLRTAGGKGSRIPVITPRCLTCTRIRGATNVLRKSKSIVSNAVRGELRYHDISFDK